MTVKQAYIRKPTIDVTFVTDNDQFSLSFNTAEEKADNGLVYNKGNMSAAIISLSATNDMNDDSGTFTLNVAGSERFDRILSPNDIIIIKINPGTPNKVTNDVVMVGMISEAKRIGEYDSASIVYQINGHSLLKALMQLKLGTIQEVASLLSTNGWMMGLGGLKGASEYLDGGNGSGSKANVKDLKDSADSKKTKVLVSAMRGSHYFSGAKDSEKFVATNTDYAIGSYVYIDGYGVAKVKYHLGKNLATTQLVANNQMLGKSPTVFVNLPATEVKKFGTQFKTIYKYKNKPATTAEGTGTGDDTVSTDGSQGLVLQGQSSASVIGQLINWFLKLHTRYIYENGKHNIKDYITQNLTSQYDEFLTDPTPIMSYEGSLRQLISDNQAKPFNEFFADYTNDGKMNIIMRPTPFEPDDWNELYNNGVQLYSQDVVEETTGTSNSEAYSIFLANMPSSILVGQLSTLLTFPLYFPDLADRYGYSMLQVQDPYIFAFTNGETNGGSDDSDGSTIDVSGNGNAEKVWNGLKSEGFTDYATAGILGNMYAESGVTPDTTEIGGGGGYGLVQWTPKSKLTTYASSVGKDYKTIATQVEYLCKQLKGTTNIFPDTAAYEPIMAATSVKDATDIFLNLYERAGVSNEQKRVDAANGYYKQFHGKGKKSKSSGSPKKKSTEVSRTDAKTNDTGNANRLKRYSTLLANWYGDNPSFISGEIRVLGNPDYRIGKVLIRYDNGETSVGTKDPVQVDYYIESVTHEFNLTSGYTTTLGVTRGLVHAVDRFKHWNTWKDPLSKENPGKGQLQFFNGGLFDEISLKDNVTISAESNDSNGGKSSGGSNDTTGVGKGDDYPSKWRNAAADSVVDNWRYYNRECVSFVAWRLSQEGKKGFSGLGNAITWYAKSGLKKQSKPKVGDVAWFDATDAPGAYGHVAYVSGINGNDIYIEEYNYNYSHAYHTRVIDKSRVTGFLRFPNK